MYRKEYENKFLLAKKTCENVDKILLFSLKNILTKNDTTLLM